MARAIDADDLKRAVESFSGMLSPAGGFLVRQDAVLRAIELAPTIEPKQEWISVKDRLPEKDTLALCVGAKGGMFLGYIRSLYGDDKTAYVRVPNARSGRYAAFWMPLPEPPEKNNEEEQA